MRSFSFISAIRRWRRLRRDIAELDGFDDRQLRDLGIRRDQILPYVRGDIPTQPVPRRAVLRLVHSQKSIQAETCCADAA